MIILDIISPERTLVHESVLSVELPGTMGRFVILKDHAAPAMRTSRLSL